jgi:hypothetical protein
MERISRAHSADYSLVKAIEGHTLQGRGLGFKVQLSMFEDRIDLHTEPETLNSPRGRL